jgi:hypothetical protein
VEEANSRDSTVRLNVFFIMISLRIKPILR